MKPVLLILVFSCFLNGYVNAQRNKKPKITGQTSLSMNEDESITILMSYLKVDDPDNWFYPWGFTMQIYPGEQYTYEGNVVMPNANFSGKLRVKVTVHDGQDESDKYDLEVAVNPVNDQPVITGHSTLSIDESQALTLLPEHLKVADPDDRYPGDFTMTIHTGNNYSVNGNQIIPQATFTGTLSVNVSVNDGTISSDVYVLPVAVVAVNRVPQITGQSALQVNEDESLTVLLSHLTVTDDDNNYPAGFTLNVSAGENYSSSGATVTPAKDFYGKLAVPVSVNDGQNTSEVFNLVVTVTPVNDLPIIADLEIAPIQYRTTDVSVSISENLTIEEPDGDSIMFAQVRLLGETFDPAVDKLVYTPPSNSKIRGVFDPNTGVLTLIGQASPERYAAAIRSVQYQCLLPSSGIRKTIFISANDGKDDGEESVRDILFGAIAVSLDIPTGFTPNGDLANDTWRIIPLIEEEEFAQAKIRVYNKEGVLVYESTGFEDEWDGRYKGELLPADTYFYTIDLNINAPEGYLKGLVTILR